MLHRLADLVTGRGPDQYICVQGHRPRKKEWANPKNRSPDLMQWVNRQGMQYDLRRRQYEYRPVQHQHQHQPRMVEVPWDWDDEVGYDSCSCGDIMAPHCGDVCYDNDWF